MGTDGSLKFDTKINTEGFITGTSSLEKAMAALTQAIERLSGNIVTHFNAIGSSAGNAADGTARGMEQIGTSANAAEGDIRSLQEQMDAISVHSMQDNAADVSSSSAPVAVPVSGESLQYDSGAMRAVFGEETGEIRSYTEAVGQYGAQAGMALNELGQEAAASEQAVSEAATNSEQEYVGLKESIRSAMSEVRGIFGRIPEAVGNQVKKVPGIVKSAFSSATRMIASFGKTLGSAFGKRIGESISGLKGLGKTSNTVSKSILKLSNMFKLMLIRMAMRAVIQGVKEGFQNLAQYSEETNQTLSHLMSSFQYLKNSFAAAFSPILTYVVPVLETLINMLATAVGYINQFFTALGGGKTFIRAKKTNENYAASLKKTGGAAKKAGKDAKEALAPFDQLNELQKHGSDSGGGGGAGGTDPSQMFEEVAIESGISDFADKLKELFDAGDWKGIGSLIGEKINEAVESFTDYISWDHIGARITSFVTAFTTMFNSLVGTIDWYAVGIMLGTGINTIANTLYLLLTQIDWQLLGSALATGLNGIVDTVDWYQIGAVIGAYFQAQIAGLYGFVSTADWPSIGQAIGTALNGTISQIDWAMLGLTFADGLSGLFAIARNFALTFDWTGFGSSVATSLSTFFQNFDWAGAGTAISDVVIGFLDALIALITETDWWAFGEGVATALENIDWTTVVNRLFAVIGAALGGFAAFLGGLLSNGIEAAGEYFQSKIEECGGNVAKGILKGISDGLIGIGKWVMDNVFEPFITAFKNAFGIHSPSTKMAEMGKYLWDGFCNGIKKFFSDPSAFIKANITDPFISKIKAFLGIHSPSTVLEEVGGNTVAGFNQGVSEGQSSTQTVVQSWAKGVATWFASKLGISSGDSAEAGKWAEGTISGFNTTISGKYTESQSMMEAWANSIRKWFVGENESSGVNEPSWKKFAETVILAFQSGIESGNSSTKAPMESWSKNIREWFWGSSNPEGTGGLYQAFYDMAKRINEGFANGINDFSYLARKAVRKWGEDVVKDAKEELEIHSPSKESYSMAEYFVMGFNNGLADMIQSSRDAVQKWLNGVTGVLDGMSLQLPVGFDISNAAAYLPRMASGTVVPPRAGEAAAVRNSNGYERSTSSSSFERLLETLIEKMDGLAQGDICLTVNLDGNEVYKNTVSKNKAAVDQAGKNPLLA